MPTPPKTPPWTLPDFPLPGEVRRGDRHLYLSAFDPTAPLSASAATMGGHYCELSTGEYDYYEVDDYTDPWTEPEIVVYQPGQGRHTDLVYHLVPLFCGRVRFIRRDLRGHGRSSEGKDKGYKFNLDTIIAEEAEFIDKVCGKPVHWLCDSTAGMLGLELAHRYPKKLKSLTLMSSPLVLPYLLPNPS